MTAIQAASLYTGLNILLLFALAFLVVRQRLTQKVAIGDGGHPGLIRAIRAHANATEYIPATLAGLIALALLGVAPWVIHTGGILFTLGRVAHGFGLSRSEGPSPGRQLGMVATWLGFLWTGGACVVFAFA